MDDNAGKEEASMPKRYSPSNKQRDQSISNNAHNLLEIELIDFGRNEISTDEDSLQ